MSQRIVQVDAFTAAPFSGNPAAVCVLRAPAVEEWMQQVAEEMNLSETAFLYPEDGGYNLRWFTPGAEVDLCGHATLASAHVLWEDGLLPRTAEARFSTRSGLLTAAYDDDWITLNFPAKPPIAAAPPDGLLEALGVDAVAIARNQFDYLVVVSDEQAVRNLQPDMSALQRISMRGVIVTAASIDPKYDFVSRFFAPAVAVPEDPVTGSAHCCLAPYWADVLGKTDFVAFQASPRGGVLRVATQGDRVLLSGQAVTVMRGELLVTT